MKAAALFLACACAAPAFAAHRLERTVEASGCGALVADHAGELAEARLDGKEARVDLDARAWRLDEPAVYRASESGFASDERYRVGDGAVRVRIALDPASGRFAAEVLPEPAGDFALALAQYLPGVALPCRASGRIALTAVPASERDPEAAARVHALLRRATEHLYDQRFDAADAALLEAERLEPGVATVRWMRARVAYLEGEALPAADRPARLEAFARAERLADEAVALAPARPRAGSGGASHAAASRRRRPACGGPSTCCAASAARASSRTASSVRSRCIRRTCTSASPPRATRVPAPRSSIACCPAAPGPGP